MPDSNPTSEAPTVHRDRSFASEQPASADTRHALERRATKRRAASFRRRLPAFSFRVRDFARRLSAHARLRERVRADDSRLASLVRFDSVSNERTAAPPSTAPCVCGTRGRRRVKPCSTDTFAASWTWRRRRISNPSSPRRTTTPRACFAWSRRPHVSGALTARSFEQYSYRQTRSRRRAAPSERTRRREMFDGFAFP